MLVLGHIFCDFGLDLCLGLVLCGLVECSLTCGKKCRSVMCANRTMSNNHSTVMTRLRVDSFSSCRLFAVAFVACAALVVLRDAASAHNAV